jgi:hypothetical protein
LITSSERFAVWNERGIQSSSFSAGQQAFSKERQGKAEGKSHVALAGIVVQASLLAAPTRRKDL